MVPVLGNKGPATHLSTRSSTARTLATLVSPGTYQKDTDFLEYLLFQLIDTLLGAWQKAAGRSTDQDDLPAACSAIRSPPPRDDLLVPPPGHRPLDRKLGLGQSQAQNAPCGCRRATRPTAAVAAEGAGRCPSRR